MLRTRIEDLRMHTTFTDEDRRFIESVPFFFLATASADSVDCSFKGGLPGFVQVITENPSLPTSLRHRPRLELL